MEVSIKNIEKLMKSMLEEQRKPILKETEKLLQEQESNFAKITCANMKIITERLEKIESDLNKDKIKIKGMLKDISELKESIDFQEEISMKRISETNKRIDEVKKLYNEKTLLDSNNESNFLKDIKKKLVDLENRSRRNNLRIDGVKELPDESWEDSKKIVKKIFSEKLQINKEIIIERAHRSGSIKSGKERSIVLKLLNFNDKKLILLNSKKLRGTDVFINEDFAKETMEKRKKLCDEVIKLRKEDKYAILKFDSIFCRDHKNFFLHTVLRKFF
ncbi:uncharacterized protein LOC136087884 [Hydra vulgaris]|uniref:Uncharacterized protein LOC136087884 n=1 Tax=Hydra vulgaris TaxID=6087 RepID=A0ABM4D020_HYDVU